MGESKVGTLVDEVEGSEPWFRERLRTLVEHKTVSPGATDDAAIRAGAHAALEIMKEAGAQAELVECSGTPSVLARFRHPSPRAHEVLGAMIYAALVQGYVEYRARRVGELVGVEPEPAGPLR